ncbi:MAG: hypothetical protein ACKOTE_14555 [Opitutaceae bacterium]
MRPASRTSVAGRASPGALTEITTRRAAASTFTVRVVTLPSRSVVRVSSRREAVSPVSRRRSIEDVTRVALWACG